MHIFNFFQTFFSSIHFEKLELYNQSIKAIPHKDCATDASSNFSSDETKSGMNTGCIHEHFCERWREICKQMACKVVRRSLCGIAVSIYTCLFGKLCCILRKNTCRTTAFEAGFFLRTKACRTKIDCDHTVCLRNFCTIYRKIWLRILRTSFMQCFLIILTIPSYSYTLCKTGCISGNGGAACFSWETLHSIMTGKTRAQKNRKTALITEWLW